MSASLTRSLIDQHVAGRAPRDDPGGRPLRPDHLVLSAAAGRLALAAAARFGLEPGRLDLALACLGPPAPAAPWTPAERDAAAAARARGCHVARPGLGGADRIHRERFAAPAKLAFAAGEPAASAGALGMLALQVDALEAALALAGEPLRVALPAVAGVRLEGGLPAWVGGFDLALAIRRRLEGLAWEGAVIELHGPGVAAVPIADRIAAAERLVALGARAALFPSDERTRRWLDARRREADWKPLEPPAGAGYDAEIAIDLHELEPLMIDEASPAGPRKVRHAAGTPVARVVLGARATLADWVRAGRVLGGRALPAGTELVLMPGGPEIRAGAAAAGAEAALVAAGARVLDGAPPAEVGPAAAAERVGIAAASAGEHRSGRRLPWYEASVETALAAALAGTVHDPRELGEILGREADLDVIAAAPPAIMDPAPEPGAPPLAAAAPPGIEGALRGAAWIHAGDAVPAAWVLPIGARQAESADDLEALADHAFATLEPGFAGRARRQRSGFVAAGRDFGGGEPAESAALALAVLGVRAVLARSYADGFARRLVHAGVLPLEILHEHDRRAIERGDELEIPGLPGALEPGQPLTVRNLTRGVSIAVGHRLDARAVAMVRGGGLLASRAAAARPRVA